MSSTPDLARFDERVVLVTGSTRGIGEGIARRFAEEGASVVISGRTEADGNAVVESIDRNEGEAIFVEADLRSTEDIEALFNAISDEFGQLDVLINNAAVQIETAVDETTLGEWERVIETDFRSYWLCAKFAVEVISKGSIINISSNHAFHTMPSHFPYNAAKAGIGGMTRAMSLDFGPNIRVNTIDPGWIGVKRTLSGMRDEERDYLESIHPVGRIGEPEDVAGVAAFLATEDAAFVTGASLLVDGGRGAVLQDNSLPDYREMG